MSEPHEPARPEGDAPQPPADETQGRFVLLPSGEVIFVSGPSAAARNGDHVHAAAAVLDAQGMPAVVAAPAEPPSSRFAAAASAAQPPAGPGRPRVTTPELVEEGLQEVVSVVPGAVQRWGITAIAAAVASMLGVAALVRLPLTVTGTAVVSTPDAPVRLAPAAGGEIARLPARDGALAASGDVLLVLKSAADDRAVARLKAALAAPSPGTFPAPDLPAETRAALGEVTQPLVAYEAARATLAAFEADGSHAAALASMRWQLNRQQALLASSESRIDLLRQEVALSEREVGRSRELVQRQLLSPAEGEKAEATLLAHRQSLESGRNEVLSQQMQITELQRQVLEAERQNADEGRRLRQDAEKTLFAVREAIAQWESRYAMRAPLSGRVSFFRRLAAGQYLAPGEAVLAVVPGTGHPAATVRIADEGVGRVRPGQRVVFRFAAYPYQEYGTVHGVVRGISLVGSDPAKVDERPQYLATVALPEGLRTTERITLPLRQEMAGTAEIITEDRSVLGRFVSRVTDRMHGTTVR